MLHHLASWTARPSPPELAVIDFGLIRIRVEQGGNDTPSRSRSAYPHKLAFIAGSDAAEISLKQATDQKSRKSGSGVLLQTLGPAQRDSGVGAAGSVARGVLRPVTTSRNEKIEATMENGIYSKFGLWCAVHAHGLARDTHLGGSKRGCCARRVAPRVLAPAAIPPDAGPEEKSDEKPTQRQCPGSRLANLKRGLGRLS